MKIKQVGVILGVAVLILIWWQARTPMWNAHLQVDIWVFWQRVSYFFDNQMSFAGMTGNEVLPAALLYVMIPIFMIPSGWLSYTTYLPAMLLLNMTILLLTIYFVPQRKVLVASLLCLGPILLFRFDATVTLLVLLTFVAFMQDKHWLSGASMGLAVGMKVFPIIFLPYLLIIAMTSKKWREISHFGGAFLLALGIPVAIFMIMGGSVAQVQSALAFHSAKLISIESIPGSIITGWSLLISGYPPPLLPGNGIWSVTGPVEIFNKLWMLPVLMMYLLVWKRTDLRAKFNWLVPHAMMLIFLVFSKNLNPQYVWWFLIFIPYLTKNISVWIVMLIVGVTNQLVYPLNYTILIDNFYRHNQDYWIFWLLLTRNIGIIYLAGIAINELGSKKYVAKKS